MSHVINILAPVFILTLIGYLTVRFTWLSREQVSGLGQFVIRIGLPAMTFHQLTSQHFSESIQPCYLIAYALACGIGFVLARYTALKRGAKPAFATLTGLSFAMVNTAFVGIPILSMVIGSQNAGRFFTMNVLVEMVFIVPLTLILLEWSKSQQPNLKHTLKNIGKSLLHNNMIIAMLLGTLVSLTHLPIPPFIHTCTQLLTQASSPIALFVLGASLYGLALRAEHNKLIYFTLLRSFAFMILVSGCLVLAKVDRETLFCGLLLSAMPLPTLYALLGLQNGYETETAAITLISTLFSLIPISIILFLWQ